MPYPDAILGLSPVFFLKLDETGGTTAADAGPNGYDGTYSGVLLNQTSAHQHGASAEFSSGDTVFLGTLPTVDASWSVSFWLRHPGTDGNYHTIVAKRDSWSSSGTKFAVWIHSSGSQIEIGNGSSVLAFSNWNPPEDNVWRHIVVVNDTVAGQRRLYVDKVLVQETTGALSDTGGASAGVSIGKNHYDTTFPDPFVGGLDDVALFNSVLTLTDVQSIYDEATTAGSTELNISGALTLGQLGLAGQLSREASLSSSLTLGNLSTSGQLSREASLSSSLALGSLLASGQLDREANLSSSLTLGGLSAAGQLAREADLSSSLALGQLLVSGQIGQVAPSIQGDLVLGNLSVSGSLSREAILQAGILLGQLGVSGTLEREAALAAAVTLAQLSVTGQIERQAAIEATLALGQLRVAGVLGEAPILGELEVTLSDAIELSPTLSDVINLSLTLSD